MLNTALRHTSRRVRLIMASAGLAIIAMAVGFVVTNAVEAPAHVSTVSAQPVNPVQGPIVLTNAHGCTDWGNLKVTIDGHTLQIPSGSFCINVIGSGNHVTSVGGSWYTAYLYNSASVVRFYDKYGELYKTYDTSAHLGYAYAHGSWNTV